MYVFRGYIVFSEMLSQYPGHTLVITDRCVMNERDHWKGLDIDSITV
jgi:hypothetical protein